MSKPSGVSWVKPAEPSFLKKFKNDVGYKEGPTVDTKRQVMPELDDGESGSDREDELPQVVVLKSGDLTEEEAKKVKADHTGDYDAHSLPEGKILFKKPAKRSSDKFKGITASSSKKKKSQDTVQESSEEETQKPEKSGKKIKNNSLLSFGGGEDDEEDEED
uniref:Zgc:77056 n=1 Tax=Cynoglossus semilaevis TaxID=244447 RepID=A0A3P8UT87_CYNSE